MKQKANLRERLPLPSEKDGRTQSGDRNLAVRSLKHKPQGRSLLGRLFDINYSINSKLFWQSKILSALSTILFVVGWSVYSYAATPHLSASGLPAAIAFAPFGDPCDVFGDTRITLDASSAIDAGYPSVSYLGNDLLVTYYDYNDWVAYNKVIEPDGSVSNLSAPSLSPVTNDGSETIIYKGLSNGNVLITWYSGSSGTGLTDVYFKINDQTGAQVVGSTKINTSPGSLNRFTEVEQLSNGNIIFTWATGGSDYAMRRFTEAGVAVDANQISLTALAGLSGTSQYGYSIAANEGRFMIFIESYHPDYYAMIFDNDASTPIQVGGSNAFKPAQVKPDGYGDMVAHIKTLSTGQFLLVYQVQDGGGTETRSVAYKIYNDDGTVAKEQVIRRQIYSWGYIGEPMITPDGFYLTYSYNDLGEYGPALGRIPYFEYFTNDGTFDADMTACLPTLEGDWGELVPFTDVDGKISLIVNDTESSTDYNLWVLRQSTVTVPTSNAAPVATAPTAPSVGEDATNVALTDNIHVTDEEEDDQTVTFTITGGTVTIGTTDITFSGGSNGSASFSASGTLAAINTALDAATFTPTANLSGASVATIAFKSNDGNRDSNNATVTFSISEVNDDPSITGLPADITATEDLSSNFDISSSTLSDIDSGTGLLDMTFTASAGTFQIAASGLLSSATGNGTSQATLTATAANLEAYLNTPSNFKYTGALNVAGDDAATVTITIDDNGNTGSGGGSTITLGTINVDITAVNDAPVAANVAFTGTLQVGAVLTGSYDYSDAENDTEDGTSLKWYRSDDNICSEAFAIPGATSISYTLQAADEGKYITFEVIPNDGTTAGYNSVSSRLGPVVLPAPVIGLKGNSLAIVNGDATPSADDHTDFGEVVAAGATASRTFTIENTGTASLNLEDVNGRGYISISGTHAADFSITTAPSSGAIAMAGSETFVIEFNPGSKGIRSATVSIASNDVDNTPYTFAIKGTGLNSAPSITSSATASVPENETTVLTVTATDADNDGLAYSLTGGADQAKFSINSSTGALTFQAAPDFEAPVDSDTDNVYEVQVTAHDGTVGVNQTVTVTVTNTNDNSPAFASAATASVAENATQVLAVSATDADAGTTIAYSISGGADQAKFSINGSTGELTFQAAPDFESPLDADTDNEYIVQVTAADGANSTNQTIAVTVTDTNDNSPVFSSAAAVNVEENETTVLTVSATDGDAGTTIGYSISGGADQARFSINGTTGELVFQSAPDFENPSDSDTDGDYVIQVTATDGTHSTSQTITVTATDANDNSPVFSSATNINVAENVTAVLTVTATDADAGTSLSYTISGGADQARFSINSATGELVFQSAADFESPSDSDTDNDYVVQVTATDGANSTDQTITVTITDENDNSPVFSTSSSTNVEENEAAVITVAASDADAGTTIVYSISGGVDQAKFSINGSTGALTFQSAPDFEAPSDADADNDYTVQITATDGTNSTDQTINVEVTDKNDNSPVFTSAATVNVAENETSVSTAVATDADAGTTISYSLTGGADQAKFSIGSSTGELTLLSAADFENKDDSDADGSYQVQVTATDGALSEDLLMTIVLTDENDNSPVFTSSSTTSLAENTTDVITLTSTDGDAGTLAVYSITGGVDRALFSISSSLGTLTFQSAPDFESPSDADSDNEYEIIVTANDGANTTNQAITITVTDKNDNSPVFTSSAIVEVAENKTAVATLAATDEDANTNITYSLSGGDDQGAFSVNSTTGELVFVAAPDFETPGDAGANNKFQVKVTASDGSNTTDLAMTIIVTNENDNRPVFTSSEALEIVENTVTVTTVAASDADAESEITYKLSGGWDLKLFNIDTKTGELSFLTAPDFEAATDANADNSYTVQVTATDGKNETDQVITVVVTDASDNVPVFTSAATASVAENTTAVMTVAAADADAGTSMTYSVSGGADQARFSINGTTGELTFNTAPDFEAPADMNGDNVYKVQVSVTDGSDVASQEIMVAVTDENDNVPAIGSSQTFEVAGTAGTGVVIGQVQATDADANTSLQQWVIVSGNEDGIFGLSAATGELTVVDGATLAAQADLLYTLVVTVTDGQLTSTSAEVLITINRINTPAEPIAVEDAFSVNEDEVLTVSAPGVLANDGNPTDAAIAVALVTDVAHGTLSIGADGSFVYTPEADFQGNDAFSYRVVKGDLGSAIVSVSLEIVSVNDAPSAITFRNNDISEDADPGFLAADFTTIDVDSDTHSYTLVTGEGDADNGAFSIDGNTLRTNTTFDVDRTTALSVRVRSTDAEGAFVESVVALQVVPAAPPEIVVPTAFTPNNDNVNDTWEIENIEFYPNVKVTVYNRVGRPVFSSIGYSRPWTGERNGQVLPFDMYYYVIDLNDGSGRSYKSYVMILK